MSKQVTLESTRAGGFGLPTGQIVPGNGSITVEPEIWAEVKDHPVVAAMVKDGTLIVDGKGKKKSAAQDERDENGDTAEMAAMRKQFDAAYADVARRLNDAEAKFGEQQKALADRDAEIAKLKQAAAQQQSGDPNKGK